MSGEAESLKTLFHIHIELIWLHEQGIVPYYYHIYMM